ncbi:MAG: LamG domain-containing protein [bacterium]|jgi:hypothetical protein|nr:LamG domain-containing protein [bacterium]
MKIRILLITSLFLMSSALFADAQLDESKLTWRPDQGISLNGTTDYYVVESASDLDLYTLTVEMWVRFRSNTGQQQLIGRGPAAQYFTHYANNGEYRFLIEDGGVGYASAATPVPPENTWVHITGTYDEQFIRLYYNGILMSEVEYPGLMRAGGDSIVIGALTAGQRHLNGLLENIRIWNRALSEEEITTLLGTAPEAEDIAAMQADGLIAYWSSRAMDDTGLQDLAGSHEAVRQVFTLDESNLTFKPEGGISFDGKSTYILIEEVEDFNLPAFSCEVWVYFDATHENQIFMNRGGAPQDFTFYLYDRIRFLVQDASGYTHANSIVPPARSWLHVVGTFSEDGTKRLYYNGVFQAEAVGPHRPLSGNNPLYIGALEPGARHLDGQLENIRFWNKALSETEILQLLQTPPDQEDIPAMVSNGLLGYWALRSIDGTTVTDLTGNGHDGRMSAFEIDKSFLTFTPEVGIQFNGTTTFAMIEDSVPFDLDFITLEAWVKLDPIFHDRTLTNRGIISRGGAAQSFSLYGGSNYGNRLHMQMAEFGDAAAPMPPADEWIHVAGTYDENTLNLYYNGVLVDSVDAPGLIDWPFEPVYIGALSMTGGYFDGAMDYIRIWNRPLSAEELQTLLATSPAQEDIAQMKQDGLLAYFASSDIGENLLIDRTGNGNDAVLTGQVVSVPDWSLY